MHQRIATILYVICRQPEYFEGVTAEEYQKLRESGKIDAYGFPVKKATPSQDAAASPGAANSEASPSPSVATPTTSSTAGSAAGEIDSDALGR